MICGEDGVVLSVTASERSRERQAVKRRLLTIRSRCRKAGIEFDLRPEDIAIPERCPLLGVLLEHPRTGKKRSPNGWSIDRIRSKDGYTRGNVWVISDRANTIKNDATLDELEAIVAGLKSREGMPWQTI